MTNILIFLAGAVIGICIYANWAKIGPAIVALKLKFAELKQKYKPKA